MTDLQDLERYVNLAQPRLGAEVLFATDDFFAEKEGLLKPQPPVFVVGEFTDRGKWMDGWESRRRRSLGHDYCIIKICRGKIYGVDIDTSYFTGNYPEQAMIEACDTQSDPDDSTVWQELIPKSSLQGDAHNVFDVASTVNWSYLRLNIYPDGGVARLRVYGVVHRDWSNVKKQELVDLAAVRNGGIAVACSDMHYGSMWNLLNPDKADNMGDGWETGRRRGEGHDWVVVQLGHPGLVKKIEVDTLHFKGNYPAMCAVRGIFAPGAQIEHLIDSNTSWRTLLNKATTQADTNHTFSNEINHIEAVSHVKLEIYPDGGVSRLRVFGTISDPHLISLVPEPLTQESFQPYGDVIEIENRSFRKINQSYADRYENLASLDLVEGGTPALSIFKSRPIELPFSITRMEHHPCASQAFVPIGDGKFLIAVAKRSKEFNVNDLRLFVTNGKQGVNYKRGVWHHFLLALDDEQEFIVIDRSNPDENTNEIELESPYPIIDKFALSRIS